MQSLKALCSALIPSLVRRHVMFGCSQDELLCVPRVFVYILSVCKYLMRLAPNDYCFRDVAPSGVAVLA